MLALPLTRIYKKTKTHWKAKMLRDASSCSPESAERNPLVQNHAQFVHAAQLQQTWQGRDLTSVHVDTLSNEKLASGFRFFGGLACRFFLTRIQYKISKEVQGAFRGGK